MHLRFLRRHQHPDQGNRKTDFVYHAHDSFQFAVNRRQPTSVLKMATTEHMGTSDSQEKSPKSSKIRKATEKIKKKKLKRYFETEPEATDKPKKKSLKRHFETEAKATDKLEKKRQKHHLETGPEGQNIATETFTFEGGNVSSWRIKKWKKRRFEKAERANEAKKAASDPKSKKSKLKQQNKSNRHKRAGDKRRSILDREEAGYLEYGSDEEVDKRLSQAQIVEAVDIASATKHFELNLRDFGPYSIDYTRNGRYLALGGSRGHLAAFDWQTKHLTCEINVNSVSSIQWLHQDSIFAAAHPSGVCLYDKQGIELHDLTNLDCVLKMQFLPHHMLLVTANEKGFLGYTDVSIGTRAAGICTGLGRLDVMKQNPSNAVICLGHASGIVTMWAPTVKGPLMKMLTHKAPVRALAIDSTGHYMATSGVDKRLKVFDLRTQKLLNATHIPVGASSLDFSQRGLLSAGLGNIVQVYKDCTKHGVVTPYLSHLCNGSVRQVEFCPFEDVLGVGHQRGFSSLIVPGSGEPNLDGMSINPFARKRQRQNQEVRLLLDKLQPEMIGLTSWVTELAGKDSGAKKAPQAPHKKLGKKQKEELQREKARTSLKERQLKESSKNEAKNPLSRFKKPAV